MICLFDAIIHLLIHPTGKRVWTSLSQEHTPPAFNGIIPEIQVEGEENVYKLHHMIH